MTMHTTLPALVVAEIDGEPRVLDTALAEQLGMSRPRDIRANLIEPNREELEAYGPLCVRTTQTGGRPATAFYLNREQALLICILSKTPKAKEVRAKVIRVFTAWTRGELVEAPKAPVLPDFTNAAEAARAWANEYEGRHTRSPDIGSSRLALMAGSPRKNFFDATYTATRGYELHPCVVLFRQGQ